MGRSSFTSEGINFPFNHNPVTAVLMLDPRELLTWSKCFQPNSFQHFPQHQSSFKGFLSPPPLFFLFLSFLSGSKRRCCYITPAIFSHIKRHQARLCWWVGTGWRWLWIRWSLGCKVDVAPKSRLLMATDAFSWALIPNPWCCRSWGIFCSFHVCTFFLPRSSLARMH